MLADTISASYNRISVTVMLVAVGGGGMFVHTFQLVTPIMPLVRMVLEQMRRQMESKRRNSNPHYLNLCSTALICD